LFISSAPFALPSEETFVGFENYLNGLRTSGFFVSFMRSVFITILSVSLILICTSMTAWFIVRVKNKFSKGLYYLFTFSMIVPFQMVMYTLSKIADMLHLGNPAGIVVVYLGFGAGLSIFMFCGFCRSIPLEIEEAAMIDGCNVGQRFLHIMMPLTRSSMISLGIFTAVFAFKDLMWPMIVCTNSSTTTLSAGLAKMQGQYGSEYPTMMAAATLAVLPMIIIYIIFQKQFVEGIATSGGKL
jgi:raffinose/stachyose/melibiose transport system permease protein